MRCQLYIYLDICLDAINKRNNCDDVRIRIVKICYNIFVFNIVTVTIPTCRHWSSSSKVSQEFDPSLQIIITKTIIRFIELTVGKVSNIKILINICTNRSALDTIYLCSHFMSQQSLSKIRHHLYLYCSDLITFLFQFRK